MEDEDNRFDDIPDEFCCKKCGAFIRDESYSDESTGYNTVSGASCNC